MKKSVAMCTYNGEKYIREQLESILNQTVYVDEIVIIDDLSTDKTVEIAKDILSKSNVDYHIEINTEKLGVSENFVKAISLTTGDIIFTSDQDDVWVNNKVEEIIKEFEDANTILVFSDAYLTDSNLNKYDYSLWDAKSYGGSYLNKNIIDVLINHNVVTGATMAFRRIITKDSFPIPKIDIYHDEWIAYNSLRFGKIVPLNNKLIYYRQHGNNVAGALKSSFSAKLKQYIKSIDEIHDYKVRKIEILFNILKKDFYVDNFAEEKLKRALEFWESSQANESSTGVKQLKFIFGNKQNYMIYHTGYKSMIRDILTCMFKNNHRK